jgi:hypothetical protein
MSPGEIALFAVMCLFSVVSIVGFPRTRKIKQLEQQLADTKRERDAVRSELMSAMKRYTDMMSLARRAIDNAEFWKRKAQGRPAAVSSLTREQINRLLQLCHPDKHGGKQSAVEATQMLLKMRN